jgi:hypothetical protein
MDLLHHQSESGAVMTIEKERHDHHHPESHSGHLRGQPEQNPRGRRGQTETKPKGWSTACWITFFLLLIVGLAGAVWIAKAANDAIMSLLLGVIGGGANIRRGEGGVDVGVGMLSEAAGGASSRDMGEKAAVEVDAEVDQVEGGLEISREEKRGGKATGCAMCVYVFPPLVSSNEPLGISTAHYRHSTRLPASHSTEHRATTQGENCLPSDPISPI